MSMRAVTVLLLTAAALAVALDDRWRGELDVELAAAESLLRLDAPLAEQPAHRGPGGGPAQQALDRPHA